MSGKLKNSVFPLAAGTLLVLTSVVSGITMSGQNSALDAQRVELASINDKTEAARSATSDLEASVSLKGPGVSADRVGTDTKIISDLLDRALDWDSDESYRDARDSTMLTYGLAEDSAFMTSFLPEAPVSVDGEGNKYPYIDAAGLNSQVGGIKVRLLSVAAVKYSYMVLADVQATSSDDLNTSTNVATVFITLDDKGAPTAISGFASTTQPRTSD